VTDHPFVTEALARGLKHGQMVAELQNDPAISHWLRDALLELGRRDPLDAANDVDLLAALMTQRLAELFPEDQLGRIGL
jgi:hypothetical protein